MTLAQGDI